VTPLARLEP